MRQLLALMLALATAAGAVAAAPAVRSHFDGERFFNPDGEFGTGGSQNKTWSGLFRLAFGATSEQPWPQAVPIQRSVPPARVEGEALRVTWIGHATVLLQTEGLNILTDPVWAERPSPIPFLGPRRVRAPGVRLHDLPKIDVVLISHNHYDHLDLVTLQFLATRDRPLIVTGLGNDRLLASEGIQALGRDWGDRVPVKPGVDIVLTRAHHWSGRGLRDKNQTLWTGFRLQLPGGDVYYAGDTGGGDMRWPSEGRGTAAIRLALLPLGPYQIDEPASGNHIDPDEAVAAFQQLDAAYGLGVHWGTFRQGAAAIDDPPRRLASALAASHIEAARFRTLEAGQSWNVPRLAAGEN